MIQRFFPHAHPHNREIFRSHLANRSLVHLICEYVMLLLLISGAGAATDLVLWNSSSQFFTLPHFFDLGAAYFTYLLGGDAVLAPRSGFWAFIKLILQTFLLGGLVFKLLLTRKAFTFRKLASVYYDVKERGWILAFRLYNASRLQVREVAFTAYLRIPKIRDGEQLIQNPNLAISKPKNKWHFALPFVPYTVRLQLSEDDVKCLSDGPRLNRIQETPLHPPEFDADGDSFLVLCVDAQCPQTGLSISESYWYRLTSAHGKRNFTWGRPVGIQTRPGREPRQTGGKIRRWQGWGQFEDNRCRELTGYVLGYGSLIHPADYWALMCGFDLMGEKPLWYDLAGYRLAWNVAMNNLEQLPNYKYYIERGTESRPDIAVTFLNIEKDENSTLSALAIPVNEAMLEHLDQRERNYNRTTVGQIRHVNGKMPLWAYLGSEQGRARFRAAKQQNKAVIVESYIDKVTSGYAAHGEEKLALFQRTATHSLRIRDLDRRRSL